MIIKIKVIKSLLNLKFNILVTSSLNMYGNFSFNLKHLHNRIKLNVNNINDNKLLMRIKNIKQKMLIILLLVIIFIYFFEE